MLKWLHQGRRARVLLCALACLPLALLLSGCQAISYYKQAITGEYQILAHQTPIPELITNAQTTPALKSKFEQVLQIRQFAEKNLSLPVDGQYLKYVDLHRPYVVWNVNVAPALSLTPKTWWFPVVGRASYRGYFSETQARHYGDKFAQDGWDVYIDGIETYSTLGWFHDPILNTFIHEPESYLAEVIFHELTHQRLFVAGDTDFNESLATVVSEEGVHRWFQSSNRPEGYARYHRGHEHEKDFVRIVMASRGRLNAIYTNAALSNTQKLEGKKAEIERLRADYAALREQWGEKHGGYESWFAEPINNAKLNTVSAYFDLVPGFQGLLRANKGDLPQFFHAAAALAKLPLQDRHAALQKLAAPQ